MLNTCLILLLFGLTNNSDKPDLISGAKLQVKLNRYEDKMIFFYQIKHNRGSRSFIQHIRASLLSLLRKQRNMITFFQGKGGEVIAAEHHNSFGEEELQKLCWLFGDAELLGSGHLEGYFRGPRMEMITPWSTNAVEISSNMGISGIIRIEQFERVADAEAPFDRMLDSIYRGMGQDLFLINRRPEPVILVQDIAAYNNTEGLALSDEEVEYLESLSKRLQRALTDSEVFGFSQVNSEHCRHKIFNGTFIIDGEEMPDSLFSLIRKTTNRNPNQVVSAYKDNVAFIQGPDIAQFAPERQDQPAAFSIRRRQSVISLKAETHNFPTTVEPFNGAATGTGGEIRDRLAGGKGSLPVAGTAVYITSYPRIDGDRPWEQNTPPRAWLYQTPEEILIKASNGASDFGNKFGQPLICGSLLTFEHQDEARQLGYDKVIMLAGGVGFGYREDAEKDTPEPGDCIVVMGGDNYRIGMGGGAVSSVATGEFSNNIELNAVQRSNPEMQKRVANAIRAMVEATTNPIVAIHDHGAGGHLNSLSELVEASGGEIDITQLPVGDPTLSMREIIGNESQERMGLIIKPNDLQLLRNVSERERAPMYKVGEVTGDHRLVFADPLSNLNPIDLDITDFFGKPPRTVLDDITLVSPLKPFSLKNADIKAELAKVLQLESVACKDWLTNKVDRSVTGRVAMQQCTGELQLPLNNVAVVAMDYTGTTGIATAIGHSPVAALIDPEAGSRLSVAEALTNLMWAPLTHGLSGVSLSANWMWPCKNQGEDARLYQAVKAISEFCIDLKINIPTGKDSLSMTQKYPDGTRVLCPGTVIISAVAEVSDIKRCITPDLKYHPGSQLILIHLSTRNFSTGGSALAQVNNMLGNTTPDVEADTLVRGFALIQELIAHNLLLAGHDVSAGGLITTLLEMAFPTTRGGFTAQIAIPEGHSATEVLFSEQPGVVIQVADFDKVKGIIDRYGLHFDVLGEADESAKGVITIGENDYHFSIAEQREQWYRTSWQLDRKQSGDEHAKERNQNFARQPLQFRLPSHFTGSFMSFGIDPQRTSPSGIKAGIIREKGVNGDREMAWSMYLAGFDVRDIHMTDLITGRETLEDLNFIVFVGGFSNSDVLGSAKGWAGAFLFNPMAKAALDKFYARTDTLSLGVCNGCQLMVELGLIYPGHPQKPAMLHNETHKFESAFLTIDIAENNSIMLGSLAGSRLGIWVAHGEGKFSLPLDESQYHIPAKYSYAAYPGNPNGSDYNTAAIASHDGRHLAIMPHLERSIYPWNWAYYPEERHDEISPWIEAFVNARKWIGNQEKK
jgi:phosphoribosylformylglycinamidine synthase